VKINQSTLLLVLFFLCAWIGGCGERKVTVSPDSKKLQPHPLTPTSVNILKAQGFQTETDLSSGGDPKALKGGSFSMSMGDFPPTYRTVGKDTHQMILSFLESVTYESLLSLDPETLKYRPSLASHWKISEDKSTYWFRIDPFAKWSDGIPVTAQDVVATFKLITDSGIQDPSVSQMFSEIFECPKVETEDVVRVHCKKQNWRSFMYFCGMAIFPAHHCNKMDGAGYLKKYQFQMMPGTGPYQLDLEKTKKGECLVIQRRRDYWAANAPQNQGYNNFDEIRFLVVRDDRLELEKFKKGEFDLYMPNRAQWWVQELSAQNPEFKAMQRGLVQKKKIFNFNPAGMSGLAFNTLEEPFDDIRVRQAFSMLWNVDVLIEKLFFGEYEKTRSYFQGSVYENPETPRPLHNPEQALKLLNEAGWKKDPAEKWLHKNGKNFEVDLMIGAGWDRIFTPLQEDLEKAGLKLNLVNMTEQAIFEKIMKRQFKLSFQGWTGQLFPNPESVLHSKYAKSSESGNITGFSLPKIDELCTQYDQSYDVTERIRLLRELDLLACNQSHYAFGWVAPYAARVAFWNRFGYPQSGLPYSGDWRSIPLLWWVDPEKDKKLEQAKKNDSLTFPEEPIQIDFWNKAGKKQLPCPVQTRNFEAG
jgi:microcin C transport system substrate-binding protein